MLCIGAPVDPPAVRYLGIEDGLPNNFVRSVYQDKKGFFWFGTKDGLSRYDGYGFKVFRNQINDKLSLVHNIIHTINGDEDYNLWIGTRQGLSVYNDLKGTFRTAGFRNITTGKTAPITNVIRDIVPGPQNTMLIGTEGLGLLIYKKGTVIAEQVPLMLNGVQTTTYGVQSVKVGNNGRVWVFAQNLGLCYLDDLKGKLMLCDTKITLAITMAVTAKQVFIGTFNGLYSYDILKKEMVWVPGLGNELAGKTISSITPDKGGELYMGTNGDGVYCYDPKKDTAVPLVVGSKGDRLKGEQIFSIFIDNNSRKWIGTSFSGVIIVDPLKKTFRTWSQNPGNNSFQGNAVSAFLERPGGGLYIGTDGAGLSIWDRKTDRFTNFRRSADPRSISSDLVTSLISDDRGQVWMGTFTEGPNRFDPATGKFSRYQLINPHTGAEMKVAFTVFEDADRDIWAGTLRRGSFFGALYKLNRSADRFELFDLRLSDLFTMMQTRNGSIWGGTLTQLVKIDKVKKHHIFYDVGYTVRAIYEDSAGLLWIGTEGGGLILFDPVKGKSISQFTTAEGLSNNSVLTLIDDHQGNLWMSTYYGVSAMNLKKRTFRNFYQSDGLQSNQFQVNAGIRLKSGEIVFGGIKGFSIFDPHQIVPARPQPNLFLTDITVNNIPLEKKTDLILAADKETIKEIRVPYDQAVFSFGFTALEYSSPDKISYQYIMEGWDRGWNNSGTGRKATYTHISEGSYVFRVKCTNAAGIWGKKEIALKITVLPPWYRTWWAYFGYFSIIAALLYIYQRYRTAQTRLEYEVQLERAAHEKERLINEQEKALTEKRMSFFTNISHEFRSPLSLIINPINDLIRKDASSGEEKTELNMIQRNAKRMLTLVDQLLLFRKADAGFDDIKASRLDLDKLSREVYLCFTQQAASNQIDYRYESVAHDAVVYADRIKVEIVLFNLLSNALKYTPRDGKVTVRLSETDRELVLTVADSGPGIPEAAKDRIFERFYQAERKDGGHKSGFGIGLYLAKQFMESHSGTVSFENSTEGGSVFCISLLKGTGHLDGTPGLDDHTVSDLFDELIVGESPEQSENELISLETNLVSDRQSILVVDDERDIRKYIIGLFKDNYTVYEAENGAQGLELAAEKLPDLIITDYRMQGIDGIELCQKIKSNPTLSYIPVILLTASSSQEIKLKSVHGGADDYINKPFEREYLIARVANLLKNRNNLQNYFFNEITLQSNSVVVSEEYKKFLDTCIQVVEMHLTDSDFGIKALAEEVGMSHSTLYKRVKSISGQSVNSFIRFIRLRKAAELMINSDHNVTEVAFRSGFNDAKYFGKQFSKLFGLNPSAFIKRHRKSFNKRYKIK
ncbi:signal transduction histidine kinase/ligand-binding sensor domain-containing protein/DNA-binding response OmpR family regulator [Pedobacter sp. AK017]|uniref:hybrid sensor histidine kinase/response regulator transcription factor n=1 Tax=Pedobacter sp. AK017 TaxID=2723073 RepID=UPI001618AAC5|nr:two-component regulator propeller domain-containing protein [Pedobacter sp. AK017]MBB5440265.1 signal transduction histidine kinase/ligand-binding sensor domain-containing protein/DNA-binding response OmpR family regulator [Pedobacter sp. AK017]